MHTFQEKGKYLFEDLYYFVEILEEKKSKKKGKGKEKKRKK